jgi:hypothetical protein
MRNDRKIPYVVPSFHNSAIIFKQKIAKKAKKRENFFSLRPLRSSVQRIKPLALDLVEAEEVAEPSRHPHAGSQSYYEYHRRKVCLQNDRSGKAKTFPYRLQSHFPEDRSIALFLPHEAVHFLAL